MNRLDKIQLFVNVEVNLLKKWNSLKTLDDLQKLLSKSKQEAYEEILGLEELKDDDGIYNDGVCGLVRNPIKQEYRNQLRNEIRERLKQITNLKEK